MLTCLYDIRYGMTNPCECYATTDFFEGALGRAKDCNYTSGGAYAN